MSQSPLWFPYAQHKTMTPPKQVEKAEGIHLWINNDSEPYIDAISSWWSVIHGYNHPRLNQALFNQIPQFSHVMMGGLTHKPAEKLAETLVKITPEGLTHVFFTDSGSVGVEVALKMAIQFWKNKGDSSKKSFISLQYAYHGDTFGAMSVSDPVDSMHHLFSDCFPKHFSLPSPAINLEKSLSELKQLLHNHHHTIAALIIEPLLQGAGGLKCYAPAFIQEAYRLCKTYNVLLIADEIATGFGRTGSLFAVNQASICPDIMILGKALTGGYMGHAATLATTEIFNAFYDEDPSKALMHGPTFMGNALACSVAQASIDVFFDDQYLDNISKITLYLKSQLLEFKHPNIKEIHVLGAMAVIQVKDSAFLKGFNDFAFSQHVWMRTFGEVIYLMPAYIITDEQLLKMCTVMKQWFTLQSR